MTVAVVVGGASGIGAAVVERQRAAGLDVVVWDRPGTGADVDCDVTDPAAVDAAAAATGGVAVVTITAGIGHGGMLLDIDPDEWDRVFAVNVRGAWLAMRALARPMLAEGAGGGGSIVVASSVSARLPDRSMGAYCASKAALDMVVRVAAAEWAPLVRVNGVAPGVTDTPLLGPAPRDGGWLGGVARRTAARRLGTADDVAEAIVALHGMRWVTGEVLRADGGLSLRSPINPLGDPR